MRHCVKPKLSLAASFVMLRFELEVFETRALVGHPLKRDQSTSALFNQMFRSDAAWLK